MADNRWRDRERREVAEEVVEGPMLGQSLRTSQTPSPSLAAPQDCGTASPNSTRLGFAALTALKPHPPRPPTIRALGRLVTDGGCILISRTREL